ncbi:hypothetical protein GCM10007973_23750 [Polymorphobacter multimanifer]|uniref:DNA-binding CsgD family transcriptional regulator n=1 Tax=Polymorphobacter multimanifer TaxID=1070431 RepID=A0A841L5N1_9SPHN|nr:DUF4019 domain-containing protein [Polymorphobacter multimanifer]MBB6226273.1 DNA-binding CsgD family transcriptional regulator [Polymorphobacter multimanifer]GGI86526.1 hypothetical protein GCM10007973_23750 [Polymorphobacter multimanifer]
MTEGLSALTEKEKAVLRLLLGGHDAKSMARHLGLSVHTINERLRDARRKLSVSSSKAAARILFEAEGGTPQLLGDSDSGGADPVPSDHTTPRRPTRAAAIGGSAMIALFVAALALSAPQNTPSAPPAPTPQIAESDATRAARAWLALVDARDWQASWAATGASFRTANTLATWQAAAETVHARFGPALSRNLENDEDIPAPPGNFRSVRFRTSFANNLGKTEVLSLAREGSQWRVVGIYVE